MVCIQKTTESSSDPAPPQTGRSTCQYLPWDTGQEATNHSSKAGKAEEPSVDPEQQGTSWGLQRRVWERAMLMVQGSAVHTPDESPSSSFCCLLIPLPLLHLSLFSVSPGWGFLKFLSLWLLTALSLFRGGAGWLEKRSERHFYFPLLHLSNCKLYPNKKVMEFFKSHLFEVTLKQRNFRNLIFTLDSLWQAVYFEEWVATLK